jgi:hypoxanthine phosphoribosyltransferase
MSVELASSFLTGRQDLRGSEKTEWRLIMTDDEISRKVDLCADYVNTTFAGKDIVLTCVLKGAAVFFVDLAKKVTIPNSWYFISASSYYNNHPQEQSDHVTIEGSIEPKKFVGKHVILIDELFDNGHTLNDLKTAISVKAQVPLDHIHTMVLFKKDKTVTTQQPDFFGVAVPDVWLVGYGLDDVQEKRGWTHLFACPKADGIPKTDDDELFTNKDFYDSIRKRLSN